MLLVGRVPPALRWGLLSILVASSVALLGRREAAVSASRGRGSTATAPLVVALGIGRVSIRACQSVGKAREQSHRRKHKVKVLERNGMVESRVNRPVI